jgi:hypothetical protein
MLKGRNLQHISVCVKEKVNAVIMIKRKFILAKDADDYTIGATEEQRK